MCYSWRLPEIALQLPFQGKREIDDKIMVSAFTVHITIKSTDERVYVLLLLIAVTFVYVTEHQTPSLCP